MKDSYFLTRQTANLMEDFAREIKTGSSLFLFYGEKGIGKSRLLEEIIQTRLIREKVHQIDLRSVEQASDQFQDYPALIEEYFVRAAKGDVIVIDHAEAASDKTRNQLFQSWVSEGVEKDLNLIVNCNAVVFDELCQMASDHQVLLKSYQVMPFDKSEIESFVCFYLFPDNPVTKLVMAASITEKLLATNGKIEEIVAIADQHSEQIELSLKVIDGSLRRASRIAVPALIIGLFTIAVGLYLANQDSSTDELSVDKTLAESDDLELSLSTEKVPLASNSQSTLETNLEQSQSSIPSAQTTIQPNTEQQNISAAQAKTVTTAKTSMEPELSATLSPKTISEPKSDPKLEPEPTPNPDSAQEMISKAEDQQEEKIINQVDENQATSVTSLVNAGSQAEEQDRPKIDLISVEQAEIQALQVAASAANSEQSSSELPIQSSIEPPAQPSIEPPAQSIAGQTESVGQRFDRDLNQSQTWIYGLESNTGTVQILLLSYNGFDPRTYYQFRSKLQRQEIDVERLNVLKTDIGGKPVYGVFYGEYDSRASASKSIRDLPEVLKALKPISRSAGALVKEIERLK